MKSFMFKSFSIVLLLLIPHMLISQIPQLMNYQGRLTDANGAPLDTTVSLTFNLYQDQGGTTSLWSETQSSVTVINGLFSVLLGSVNPIPTSVFDGSVRYLGMQMGSGPSTSLPMPIVSAAYAMKAGHADTAEVALSGGSSVWSVQGNNTYYNTGNVGIGTNIPGYPLQVISPLSYANLGGNSALAGGHSMSGSTGYLGGMNVGAFGSGNLYGIWGISNGGNGIFGQATLGGYAGYFEGKTRVTGDFLVSDTGKIGIGTSNIGAKLDLAGPEDTDLLIFEAGSADRFSITTHASGPDYLSIRSKFENPDSQIVVFRGDGKVGIGTTNPNNARLGVVSSNMNTIRAECSADYSDAVRGIASGIEGAGIVGTGTSSTAIGVKGTGVGGRGVEGVSESDYGVYGRNSNSSNYGYLGSTNIAIHGENNNGNSGSLGGPDYGVSSDGDLVVDGAYRGNIGPNNGAPFPRPAYNSGWVVIDTNQTITLNHNIGGDVNNYIVDMQFKSGYAGFGINISKHGGDVVWGTDRYEWGAYWKNLTVTTIDIVRFKDDGYAAEMRIRIWVYN